MNLVEAQGSKFANREIAAGEVVYADGSDEAVPYFWAMGERFAIRVDFGGECPKPFCGEGSPVASVKVFERTFNGPGSDMMEVADMAGHVAGGESARFLAATTLEQAAASVPAELVELFEQIAPEKVAIVVWARDLSGLLSELTVADEVAAYLYGL